MAACCLQECQIQQLQLNSSEVAAQLTLRDFHLFHDVEPTEYVDELFELDSKYGHPHLDSFSRVSATPSPNPPLVNRLFALSLSWSNYVGDSSRCVSACSW